MAFTLTGCTDEPILELNNGAVTDADSPLQLSVCSFSVNGDGSRAAVPSDNPEPETEEEKKIENFWLFQFNPDGTQLAAPAYYSIPADGNTLKDLTAKAYGNLTRNTPMTIYVVTNLGNATWATGTDFDTLEKVKAEKLPSPYPIRIIADETRKDKLIIPMSGQVDNVTVTDKSLIVVPVTRMYAKIKIQASFPVEDMSVYDVAVSQIPFYCRVAPVGGFDANGEPAAVPLPEGTEPITRSFKSADAIDGWITIYVPENIRGEVAEADKMSLTNIPKNALNVNIRAKYDGMDFDFKVYPGENSKNNFNVRRNCVYRVTVNVLNATDQHKPSSNCFVVKPNSKVTFEPYNRIETGGGYNISTYLNPDNEDLRIATTEIIWQDQNTIGDNTDGSKVKFTLDEDDPIHSKLTVYTGEEGNALVGARNSKGEIVWSWHIWVTDNEPDNFANGFVYTTYRWDNNGIYKDEPRVPGYGIMPCNLGALAFRSEDDMPNYPTNNDDMKVSGYSVKAPDKFPESQCRTFGMLYQWGRKDPFPPITHSTGTEDHNGTAEYTEAYADTHYANDNKTIVSKSSSYQEVSNSFYSKCLLKKSGWLRPTYSNEENPVKYGIAHPTVYISGTMSTSSNDYNPYKGDWCGPDGSYGLWGGTENGTFSYEVISGHFIKNNYGKKSIFDPCPTGWRVPPGDLWLGFTKTGLNPEPGTYEEQVNYNREESGHRPGLSMYVRGWQSGPTTYFPLQGTRQRNGICHNPGLCGNYHNATCDGNYVNILHLHRNMDVVSKWNINSNNMLFRIFETTETNLAKSTASPVRCVRDSK